MKSIEDYDNPFNAISDFEAMLARYTGAPYVVCTDSCTHAMELCFRYTDPDIEVITIPARTYLSVPMMLLKLGYTAACDEHYIWTHEYRFSHTPIWDCARAFNEDMYIAGRFQCLSFGHSKRLEIGHGGAILCDDLRAYTELKKMAYDGRDLEYLPWQKQKVFSLGFHYNMRPEDAVKGMRMLHDGDLKSKLSQIVEYPDLSKIEIIP